MKSLIIDKTAGRDAANITEKPRIETDLDDLRITLSRDSNNNSVINVRSMDLPNYRDRVALVLDEQIQFAKKRYEELPPGSMETKCFYDGVICACQTIHRLLCEDIKKGLKTNE